MLTLKYWIGGCGVCWLVPQEDEALLAEALKSSMSKATEDGAGGAVTMIEPPVDQEPLNQLLVRSSRHGVTGRARGKLGVGGWVVVCMRCMPGGAAGSQPYMTDPAWCVVGGGSGVRFPGGASEEGSAGLGHERGGGHHVARGAPGGRRHRRAHPTRATGTNDTTGVEEPVTLICGRHINYGMLLLPPVARHDGGWVW